MIIYFFSFWLSLSLIILSFVCVPENWVISFLFLAESRCTVYMHHFFFMHLSLHKHIVCFHLLHTMKCGPWRAWLHEPFRNPVSSSDARLEWFCRHLWDIYFLLLSAGPYFSLRRLIVYMPPAPGEGPLSFTPFLPFPSFKCIITASHIGAECSPVVILILCLA